MYIGANVLLPAGLRRPSEANVRYPVEYHFAHFTESAPHGFEENGSNAFSQYWLNPTSPKFISVEVREENPFYDSSYIVDSPNVGPYGTATTKELIPALDATVPHHRRPVGPRHLRRLDRRLGSAGLAGLQPRRLRRHLRRLPRPGRLPPPPDRRRLRRRQRLQHPAPVRLPDPAPRRPEHRRRHCLRHGAGEPVGAGPRRPRPLRRRLGDLGGGVRPAGQGRLPGAGVGQAHRRDRQHRRARSGSRRTSTRSSTSGVVDTRTEAARARCTCTSATWTPTTSTTPWSCCRRTLTPRPPAGERDVHLRPREAARLVALYRRAVVRNLCELHRIKSTGQNEYLRLARKHDRRRGSDDNRIEGDSRGCDARGAAAVDGRRSHRPVGDNPRTPTLKIERQDSPRHQHRKQSGTPPS